MITEIMYIDNGFDDLEPQDRLKQRQLVLTEKVDAYFAWIKEKYLRTFLSDGETPMDNNYAEQAIRPFTIGRKNFVLIESSNGARASAVLYSIAETAKANGINTYKYLELLLTEIPQHMADKNLNFIENLLPWSERVQKECPSKYKTS